MQIIGASGHAKVVIDIICLNMESISGIWDDNSELQSFCNYEINGSINDYQVSENTLAIVAIGNNVIRKQIVQAINAQFGVAIHPNSTIANRVKVNEGTVVMANVTVNQDAVIGKHVILNTNSSIDHDCRIFDFVHISPQVGLAGSVEVGEGAHVGIGANVIQGIKIGCWATIGAGAVIIRDVPDYAVVVGNPGRIVKYNTKIY